MLYLLKVPQNFVMSSEWNVWNVVTTQIWLSALAGFHCYCYLSSSNQKLNQRACEPTHSCLRPNSNVVLLLCQTKFINYINVFWRDCVPAGRIITCFQQCSENPEFGTTLVQRLNQSRTSAVLPSNLIAIKLGTAEARRLNLDPPPPPPPQARALRYRANVS